MKKMSIFVLFLCCSTSLFADVTVVDSIVGYPAYEDGLCGNDNTGVCLYITADFPLKPGSPYNDLGVVSTPIGGRFDFFSPIETGLMTDSSPGIGYINVILTEDFIFSNGKRPGFTTDELTLEFTTYGEWKNNLSYSLTGE